MLVFILGVNGIYLVENVVGECFVYCCCVFLWMFLFLFFLGEMGLFLGEFGFVELVVIFFNVIGIVVFEDVLVWIKFFLFLVFVVRRGCVILVEFLWKDVICCGECECRFLKWVGENVGVMFSILDVVIVVFIIVVRGIVGWISEI